MTKRPSLVIGTHCPSPSVFPRRPRPRPLSPRPLPNPRPKPPRSPPLSPVGALGASAMVLYYKKTLSLQVRAQSKKKKKKEHISYKWGRSDVRQTILSVETGISKGGTEKEGREKDESELTLLLSIHPYGVHASSLPFVWNKSDIALYPKTTNAKCSTVIQCATD